jgi:Holliday junction resolvase-like predicted endonuclease
MNYYEEIAVKHLVGLGHRILACNYTIIRDGFKGEIDVISFFNGKVFLNEVKKRSEFAEGCVSFQQMERIWNVWECFFKKEELFKHFQENVNFLVEIQLVLVFKNECSVLQIQ